MGRAKVVAIVFGVLVILALGVSLGGRFLKRKPLDLPPPGKVRLEVLNGCGVDGLGKTCAQRLAGFGFDVRDVGTTSDLFERTLVFDRTDPRGRNALALARALGYRGRRRVDLDSVLCVDVTVIVGADYRRYFERPGRAH